MALISIGGLGISGAYLLHRLKEEGIECQGYDPRPDGFITPCGYAVNWNVFSGFASRCGLDPDAYLQCRSESAVFMNDSRRTIRFNTSGLCTIDKNAFVRDMIGDTVYNRGILRPGKEGIVIDASGVSRSMLGPCAGDFTMRAVEYIVPGREVKDFLFRYFPSGTGYYWEFPMKGYSHIGAGSDDLGRIQRELSGYSGNRVLARNIRLSPLFDHLHRGNIVGVGEAIGTVSPITGEGIGPSLESAEILFGILKRNEEVDSIMEKYHREINLKFRRFRKLYELLLKTRQGKLFSPASLGAISAVREDFRNFGIDFSLKGLLRSFI